MMMPLITKMEEVVAKIGPRDFIAFGYVHSGFEPLFEAFKRLQWDRSIEVFIPCILRYRQEDIFHLDKALEGFGGKLLITQVAPECSGCINPERVDILPLPLSIAPRYLREMSAKRKTWLFCEISPPNEKGMCNTGYSVPFPPSLYKNCQVVGMINERIPPTYGDTSIPARWFDYFIDIPDQLPLYPELEITDTVEKIGANVSSLIGDNFTIQAGIGDIAAATLMSLRNRKNLTFESGLLPEEVKILADEKAITGHMISNVSAARSMEFYEWMKMNPAVHFKSMEYTHNIAHLSQLPNFTVIGGAVAVDLLGQAACETVGLRQISGIGGALDFSRAAGCADGKGIIALTSAFGKNNTSKIVPRFDKGDVISMTRYDVNYVVTEYGLADLKYQSRRDKALRLIGVAHPDHRGWLLEEATKMNIV